jgi:hypothetical protein
MGRVRRGGYVFMWWAGDHPPRHVHVFDKNQRLITRVELETLRPMDAEKVNPRILALIRELQSEGRL